jgi:hypothetical protein
MYASEQFEMGPAPWRRTKVAEKTRNVVSMVKGLV